VLSSGAVVIDTEVVSPSAQVLRSVHQHTPGAGNSACWIAGSALPSVGPNLGNSASFSVLRDTVILDGSQVFAWARTNATSALGFEAGVWRICNGAPAPIALTLRTGALGPNIGIPSAYFADINSNVRNGGSGELLFSGDWVAGVGFAAGSGIFRQRNGVNTLIAKRDDAGTLGPNWQGARFSSYVPASLIGAGPHAAFAATAKTPDNTLFEGIWRIRPNGNPEPVALVGVPGAFGPKPTQSFQSIGQWTILANGDVIAECFVSGSVNGLYLFRVGQVPQLILSAGQLIPVTTSTGSVQASVISFSLPNPMDDTGPSSRAWAGIDSWAGTDGSVLARAVLNVAGTSTQTLLLPKWERMRCFAMALNKRAGTNRPPHPWTAALSSCAVCQA
jgi:hypothetical protein